jgi:hypothetical protein
MVVRGFMRVLRGFGWDLLGLIRCVCRGLMIGGEVVVGVDELS